MDILDAPQDIPFLGKLIHREIIYRLLHGTQGARLRAIATLGDQSYRTEKAVAWLRENYEKPLRVEQLATRSFIADGPRQRSDFEVQEIRRERYQAVLNQGQVLAKTAPRSLCSEKSHSRSISDGRVALHE